MKEALDRLNQDAAELLADILTKRVIEERKRRRKAALDYDREVTQRMLEAAAEPPVYMMA